MLKSGSVIDGKYKIVEVIGKGGMSTVYLAEHQLLGQKWAVKEIQRETGENQALLRQSLLAETNILKRLNHPNLPRIIDVIQTKESMLLVMDYIEGITLQEYIDTWGPQDEQQVVKWAKEICNVLLYLHTRKPSIIYCDLKPSNLMLKEDGTIMLIDFGTAREYSKKFLNESVSLGTDGFAAPEQYMGRQSTDERTDIYCFGMTVYALLTGIDRKESAGPFQSKKQKRQRISSELEQIIATCTCADPSERYQDCFALKYALCHLEENQMEQVRKEKRRKKMLGVLLTGVLFSGCILFGVHHLVEKSRYQKAMAYVNQAEKGIVNEKILENYKMALQILPSEKKIYDSIVEYFIHPNHFSMEEAAAMMNLFETASSEKNVLGTFCKKNPEGYCEFCYMVGIGYFYYMGGMTGKKEARTWFQDVIQTNSPDFDGGKRERAELYEEICRYYDTFIANGEDNSGERKKEGFGEFYDTLHKLNQITLEDKITESDAKAAYLISKEIAIEIGNYAQDFLKEKRITAYSLQKELFIIEGQGEKQNDRITLLSSYFEEKEINELRQFVEEAKKKVDLADQMKNQEGE